ncbi:MAG: mechanosensitive ion channel family protein [Caulobacteraceae bacterium]
MSPFEGLRVHLLADVGWAPPWVVTILLFALCLGAGWVGQAVGYRLFQRMTRTRTRFWPTFVARTRGPVTLAVLLLAGSAATSLSPIGEGAARLVRQGLLIAFVVLVGWIANTAMQVAANLYLRRYKMDVEDNLLARKHRTQAQVLERVLQSLLWVLTLAFALMTVPGVKQWGVSLLASAGAAGIIAGLALQPFLTNIFAGVQIAMAQPIRLDDAVIVEGEWGWIEEITTTYVVVRLWDWRRMVLPLTYFIQKPFQNWTRESSSLIGTVMLYVDYATPVQVLRDKLAEIASASSLWDRQVVNLAVTDFSERAMQVRCLVSARNASQTFDLRCEVREKMIAFLQKEYPQALPLQRGQLSVGGAAA